MLRVILKVGLFIDIEDLVWLLKNVYVDLEVKIVLNDMVKVIFGDILWILNLFGKKIVLYNI